MSEQQSGDPMSLRELVEYVARSLADRPDEVRVREVPGEQTLILELQAARVDVPRLIGREGRVVNALRQVLAVAAAREGRRVRLEVV